MSITLERPIPDHTPTFVPAGLVSRIDVMHVPTSLREHAEHMLAGVYGPGERWFSMGTWYPAVAPRTLLARRMATGELQYGTPLPPLA